MTDWARYNFGDPDSNPDSEEHWNDPEWVGERNLRLQKYIDNLRAPGKTEDKKDSEGVPRDVHGDPIVASVFSRLGGGGRFGAAALQPVDLHGFGPPEADLSGFSAPEAAPAPQVRPGEAAPVQAEPAAQRRLLMAVPPPELPDNLGVYPVPRGPVAMAGPGPQAARPGAYTLGGPDMAAFHAANADIAPEQATQALVAARRTGMSPQFAADTLPQVQAQLDQQDTADKLARAPALAGYANRGAVEASAVKDSLDDLSLIEWAITGRWELSTVNGDPTTVQRGKVTPPFWMAALRDALNEQKFIAMTTKEAEVGLNLEEEQQLAEIERGLAAPGSYGAKNWFTKLVASSVRALPNMLEIGAGSALGAAVGSGIGGAVAAGPGSVAGKAAGSMAGATLVQFGQTYGPLYHRLINLPGPDEQTPLLTDDEARAIAAMGAMATAAVSTAVGLPFLQKLPGVREVLGRIGVGAVAQAMARPGVAQFLAEKLGQYGKNYVSGIAMMMAQAAGNTATEEAAKLAKAKGSDEELLYRALDAAVNVAADMGKAGVQGAKDLPLLSAYHPIVETIGAIGRARAEQAHLTGMVDAAKKAPLVTREPGVAAEVIQGAADQPGAAGTAYVSKEVWDKHWRAQGEDPADIAAQVMGDRGRGYAEADATGGPLAVPIEKYVTDLVRSGDAEKLTPDTALSADGLSGNEAAKAAENLSGQGEPMPGPAPEPTRAEAASYKDAARSLLEEKAIGDIRPEYYDAAVLRAGKEAINVAGERDKAAEKVVAEYAKALDTTQDLAREAIAGARKGFYGAGMQAVSGGELGAGALREAGRDVTTAERRLGKRSAEAEAKLASLEAQHGANDIGRQAEVDHLLRQQQLSAEAAKMARNLRAEMDKLQAGLSRVDRAALAAGDPAYLSAYDAMMGALQGQDSPGALDRALARMQADARPLGFDEAAVADLLANPRPWAKLTPAEARNLSDAVASIRKAAADANEVALADRRASLREFVAGVAQYAAEHGPGGGAGAEQPPEAPRGPAGPLPPPSNAGKGRLERAGETVRALATEGVRAEVILRRLGAGGDQVMDSFTKARNYHAELQGDVGEVIGKAIEKMPAALRKTRADGVDGPGSPVVDDNKWTRQDLRMLAGWFGSESGAQRLRDGLRITDEQIRTALEQLTKPEAEFIDSLHALNDEKLWPLIRDHETARTGTSPPKIDARPFTVRLADGEIHTFRGGYWPGADADPAPRSVDGAVSGFWGTLRDGFPTTAKSFVNERSERTAYRPDLNWDAYAGHVNAVLRYLAFDDFVSNAGRIFLDKQFRDVVANQQGPQAPLELDKFVTTAARGYVEAAQQGASKWSAVVGGGFRSRIATGAFQLNVPVVVGQLSHIPAAMFGLRIMPWHMLEGLGKAFVPGSWAEAHANSEQLPYRWNGYGSKMREMLSAVGPGEPVAPRRWLDAAGWSLYHGMDGFLSKTIWEAARAKAGAAGLDELAQFKEADKAVSAMMPPLNLAEQSSLARDRGLIGSLLLVRNFPNTLFNVGAMNAWQARTGIWAAQPGWRRAGAVVGQTTLAAASYLGMVWSAHIFGRFLMGHGRQEDESAAEWLARDAMTAPFYPVPFGGAVEPLAAAAVANVARDKPVAQTLLQHNTTIQSAPALALLENAVHDFGLAMSDNRMDSDRMYAAAKLAAAALRLPVYPLKPARYAYDLLQGDVQPRGPFDIAGGFLYGQRPKQTRNPLTAAQDLFSGD